LLPEGRKTKNKNATKASLQGKRRDDVKGTYQTYAKGKVPAKPDKKKHNVACAGRPSSNSAPEKKREVYVAAQSSLGTPSEKEGRIRYPHLHQGGKKRCVRIISVGENFARRGLYEKEGVAAGQPRAENLTLSMRKKKVYHARRREEITTGRKQGRKRNQLEVCDAFVDERKEETSACSASAVKRAGLAHMPRKGEAMTKQGFICDHSSSIRDWDENK